MTGQTISHYEIQEQLGSGGMGVVYRAKDTKLDRTVALKFLPKEVSGNELSRQRFMTEARASAKLTHANICAIHDVHEQDDQLFMVMECIEGVTLKERLSEGPVPVDTAISFAIQIAKGLDRAHESGIAHRDIKPANIMVTNRDEIKILDFGLAKFAGGVDITKSGSTIGTAAYMSPEQMRGEEIDHRADIWALGATLYEMLAGKRPFGGDYEAAVGYAILNEDPEPLAVDLPKGLEDFVRRCLAKKTEERYQSANDLIADLALLTNEIGISSPLSSVPTRTGSSKLSIIAMGVFLLAALVWFLIPSEASTEDPVVRDMVAVFPFSIRGDSELDDLRDGMVSLLSNRMDGVGPIRTVDYNRILARVSDDEDTFFDPDESGLLAAGMNASTFILGSVVTTGARTEILANIYDLEGEEIGAAKASVDQESDLPRAIDDLALQLIRLQLAGANMQSAELVSPTTTSFEALRFLIAAEKATREGRPDEGYDLAEQALAFDSTLATAWYVRFRAATSSKLDSSPEKRDVERHKNSLPPRLQRLFNLRAFYSGTTEQILRAFLREYPDDVAGIGLWADNIYHWGPQRFESASDAIPMFRQVLELDPDHGEYSYHLLTQLLRDRRLEEANLFREERYADDEGVRLFYGLLTNDPKVVTEAFDQFSERTNAGRDLDMWLSASGLWNDLDMLDDSLRAGSRRRKGVGVRAKVAVGKVEKAKQYLQEEDGSFWWVLDRSKIALLPGSESDPDFLMQAESEVLAWLSEPDSIKATMTHNLFVEDDELEDIVFYLSAQMRLRLQDDETFAERHAQLRERAIARGETSLSHHLNRRLDGLVHYSADELEEALEALTEGLDYRLSRFVIKHLLTNDGLVRSTRAEVLAGLGRYEEAIITYRSLNDGFDWLDSGWEGPGFLRRAQWYEELGDIDSAIDFYGRFVELWAEADPHLQPQVEDARERLDELVIQQAGEPQN